MTKALQRSFGIFYLLSAALALHAQPNVDFAFAEGTSETNVSGEFGNKVAADNNGNFFVVGAVGGASSFSGFVTSQGNLDIFVAKYDEDGTLLWVTTVGAGNLDSGTDIAYNPNSDQLYIIGTVQGGLTSQVTITSGWLGVPTASFTSVVDNSGTDVYIGLFDGQDGSLIGDNVYGGSNNDNGFGITVDELSGQFYATGTFRGNTVDFGSGFELSAGAGLIDNGFILSASPSFVTSWAYGLIGTDNVSPRAIDYWQDNGQIGLTGYYNNDLTYQNSNADSIGNIGVGGRDIFIASYNSDGSMNVALEYGGTGNDTGNGVAWQQFGDLMVSGYFSNTIDLGATGSITSNGGEDIFIGSIVGTDLIWVRAVGSTSNDRPRDIQVTEEGDPIIVGYVGGDITFGVTNPISITGSGTQDAFIAKYGQFTAEPHFAQTGGGSSSDQANGLGLSTNRAFLTGQFNSTDATFGSVNIASSSGTLADDIWVSAITGTGNFIPDNTSLFDLTWMSTRATWADFNQDGHLDLVYSGYNGSTYGTQVYAYNSLTNDFTLTTSEFGASQGGIEIIDLNLDGNVDVHPYGFGGSDLYTSSGGTLNFVSLGIQGAGNGGLDWADFDRDGDIDLVTTGAANSINTSALYRNDGGVLSDTGSGIRALDNASVRWADLDGTGNLELIMMGEDQADGMYLEIAYPDIDGNYYASDTVIAFSGMAYGEIAVGDYDADGDYDIAVTGYDVSFIPRNRIYRNDGNKIFTELGLGLTGFSSGSLDWGDFDNDGDLDLLASGSDDISETAAVIFRNDGAGVFTEIDFEFTGIKSGDVRFGDYDNDGDLDLVLTGFDEFGGQVTDVWENQELNDNSVPNSVTANAALMGVGSYNLTWQTTTDDLTPAAGLTYNLAVSLSPGGTDYVISPLSLSDGTRLVAKEGNMGQRTSFTLTNLAPGTYYWRVQAVDGAFKGGAFSSEQSFTIDAPEELAFYSFDNASTLNDLGTGFDGTATGTSTEDSRRGETDFAIHFESGDYVSGAESFALSSLTISGWIYPDLLGTGSTNQILINERDQVTPDFAGPLNWQFEIEDDGLTFTKSDLSGVQQSIATSGILKASRWQHVAVSYDDVTGLATLYVNGESVGSSTLATGMNNQSFPWLMGKAFTSFGDEYVGRMDDFHVFNYAFSDADMFTLYTDELGVDHWFLKDGVEHDAVGGLLASQSGAVGPTSNRFGDPSSAFIFDGTGTLNYGNNTVMGGSSNFSISAWFNPNFSNSNGTVISQNDIGDEQMFFIDIGNDNVVFLAFPDGTNGETLQSNDASVQPFNWNHVVVTFDNGNTSVYLNNELKNTGTLSTPIFDGLSNLVIGAGTLFDGSLDDIRIYDHPLSDIEVADLFFEGGWTGVGQGNLQAYYPFDNGQALDESGNGFDGTPTGGASAVADRFGNPNSAMFFDGSDGYIDILHNAGLDIGGPEFTLNAWIKPSQLPNPPPWSVVVSYSFNDNFYYNDLGELVFHWPTDGISSYADVDTNPGSTILNEWSMATWTLDGASNLRMYIDGVLWYEQPIIRVDVGPQTSSFIGGDPANDRWFEGEIDDVSFYDVALSQSEIDALLSFGGWTGNEQLIGDWPISSSLGGQDVSGFDNHIDDEGSGVGAAADDRFFESGGALQFLGGGTYGVAKDFPHPTGSFSYSLWEKHTSGSGTMVLMSYGDGTNELQFDLDNESVVYSSSNQLPGIVQSTLSNILSGRWNHIVVSAEDGNIKIYVNGELQADESYAYMVSGSDLFFGSRSDLSNQFIGDLDDIKIYNYALDADEVQDLFNEGVDTSVEIAWLEPSIATPDDGVTIFYNAERGNKALMGTDRVYIHFGAVIGTDPIYEWGQYVLDTTWFSDPKDNGIGEMSNTSGNTWQYTVSPSARSLLGVPSEDLMQRLGMIFRSPDAILIGKGTPSEYGDFPGGRVEDGTYWTPGDIYLDLVNPTSIGLDSLILVDIYNSLDGDNWTDNANWLSGPLSTWFGVILTGDGQNVAQVTLDNNNLSGALPTSIGQLTAVTTLSLSGNSISGNIPSETGDMTSLTHLWLDDNQLTGSIPPELANIALQELHLDRNQLTGSIPSEFGAITSLIYLSLYSNSLSGIIPTELGNLTNLEILDIEDNLFTGTLPGFISNMTSLQQVWLGDCAFTGPIPIAYGNLSNLTHLILGNNNLNGRIPVELGNLINLTHLELSDNNFTGDIFDALANISSLVEVYLDNNQLTGVVPDGFSSASNLRVFSISGNSFESIPDLSGTSLEELYVANNEFTFEDLLVNLGVPSTTYDYAPQNLAGDPHTRFTAQDMDYTFGLFFDDNVSGSSYAWNLNQASYATTSSNFLDFIPITTDEGGDWQVSITNPTLPDLTLTTEIITLNVLNICTSAPSSDLDTKINRVVIGDIDNVSGSSGSDCQSYSNFTHLSTTVYPGQDLYYAIEVGYCGSNSSLTHSGLLLVDLNQDGSFDSSTEALIQYSGATGDHFTDITLPLPSDLPLGTFLMRWVVSEVATSAEVIACGTYGFGETEDYTLNVVEASSDLAIDLISATPISMFDSSTPLLSGDDMLVTTNVGNFGITSADVTRGINYYLSLDQIWDAGTDIDLGSIPISGLGSGEFISNSDEIVNTTGVAEDTYYLIVVADPDNTLNDPDFTDNVSVSSIPLYIGPPLVTDTTPPVISITDGPTSYTLGSGGIPVSAAITDDTALSTVTFSYAPIRNLTDIFDVSQTTNIFPEEITPGVYSHTIPDSDFDGIGVAYYFGALDDAGNAAVSTPTPRFISTRFGSGAVDTPSAFGVGSAESASDADYKLFSVPVRDATIASALGVTTLEKDKIRIYRYSGSNQEITSSTTQLAIGSGYWLIYVSGEVSFDFSGLAATSTNDNLFTYNLSSGINLIGNPYNFPISWSSIVNHNVNEGILAASSEVSSGITTFNRGFIGGVDRLGVGEAGFINANITVNLEVPFTAETSQANQGARLKQNPLDSEDWRVGIDLSTDQLNYHVASIGMNPEAQIGLDNFDHPALPYLSQYVELNSKNRSLPERISQDIVETELNHVWEFEAVTNNEASEASLGWDNSYFGDNEVELYLYDITAKRIVNMRQQTEYKFYLDERNDFRIVYGDEAFIEVELQPRMVTMNNAFPNPLSTGTTIEFALAESDGDYRVQMGIYNSMGRLIKVLVDRELGSGFHKIGWDATNETGQRVADGIYIYKLQVKDGSEVKEFANKLILTR